MTIKLVNETPYVDVHPPPSTCLPGLGEGAALRLPLIERRVAEIEEEVGKLNAGLPLPWSRSALVPAPRSLPAHWRRYAAPGPLAVGMVGGWALWQLPASIHLPMIVVLLVAVAAIRRYVPDAVPKARAVRGGR